MSWGPCLGVDVRTRATHYCKRTFHLGNTFCSHHVKMAATGKLVFYTLVQFVAIIQPSSKWVKFSLINVIYKQTHAHYHVLIIENCTYA